MKKKIFILRFGSKTPLTKEIQIMDALTEDSGEVVGCSTAIGVISIINTRFTLDKIIEVFRFVAEDTDDHLPVIAWEEGAAKIDLTSDLFENFQQANEHFDQEFGPSRETCTLSLDELLDMVNSKGLENFTDVELKRLKELSR